MSRTFHILLVGYYGHANAGDECVLAGIKQALAERPDHPYELRALSGIPANTQQLHGIRSYARFSPAAVMTALVWSDCLVLGGGSLIQDATSKRSAQYYLWLIRLALTLKKRVFLWAQGFGPLSDPGLRFQSAALLSRAHGVTVRDEGSLQELTDLGVAGVAKTADPAFLIVPSENLHSELAVASENETGGCIGVALRRWPSLERAEDSLASAIHQFSVKSGLGCLYIPFHHTEDIEISDKFADRSQTPSSVMSASPSPAELVTVFQELSIVLGMRLHSLILAARATVPFVGLSYDPKVERFCRSAGMPCLTIDEITSGRLEQLLLEVWENREPLSYGLERFSEDQRNLAQQTASHFWRSVK
ncbi:MAG: polysaccharide pyruvyl transferase CsaB [Armatimonadota bacterium]